MRMMQMDSRELEDGYDPKTSVTLQSGDYAMEEERTDGRKRTICRIGPDRAFYDNPVVPGFRDQLNSRRRYVLGRGTCFP